MTRPVILITDSLSRQRGGAEIYLANLAEFIAQHGRPVHALVRRACPAFSAAGVRLETVPAGGSGLCREKNFAREIQKRLQGKNAVVLSTIALPGVTHYQPHMGVQRRSILASRDSRDSEISRWLHRIGSGFNFKRRWLLQAQSRLLARESATQVMVFSQRVRDQMVADFGLSPARIVTVPHGVDLNRFHPAENPARRRAEKLTLLFVAHNFRLKGLQCLLAALARAVPKGLVAELLVVGHGQRAAFEKMAAQLGLAAHVRFLGAVDEAGTAQLYRDSDVLVHPTFADHCSLVVLEALASGLPVITTRQNGAGEFIESGKSGFILNHPREIEALADALLRLQDRTKRTEMSAAAAALRPQLDFNHHAQQVLAWLNRQ